MIDKNNNLGMADMEANKMVSIIMLSKNQAQFVEESVRSVMAQTYKNWELLFVDDNSKDKTINLMMKLKDEARIRKEDYTFIDRIKVTQTVYQRGETMNRNSSVKEARGRWIAFLDAGDIWEPTKLEKQVRFMEENGYSFSYTQFRSFNAKGMDLGIVMSGPDHITERDMLKCCWMGYLTVMYDAGKVGLKQVKGLNEANDYALWMLVAEKNDCHLLPECLAKQLSVKGLWWRLLTSKKWMWRYEAYRKIEDVNPIKATYYTIRNMFYTAYKWCKYAKKS
jgi:glycosyltransferase involved in cell wall biosynthesis